MRVEHGFGPVWDAGSRVLVLGSVPSPKSREMRFFIMVIRAIVSGRSWRLFSMMIVVCASAGTRTRLWGCVGISLCVTIWRYGM